MGFTIITYVHRWIDLYKSFYKSDVWTDGQYNMYCMNAT